MDTVELTIQDYSKKGHGLALYAKDEKQPQVIEVAHTVHGDRVLVQLMRKNKRKKKGKLLEIIQPSKYRTDTRCSHAQICGGCSMQQVGYDTQLALKQKRIEKFFKPLLEESAMIEPILPAIDQWRYRNKMEFSFSENRAGTKFLGLMIAQGASYVFDVHHCYIAPQWFSDVLHSVRAWWEQSSIPAFQFRDGTGVLRNLTLREGKRTGQKLVMLTISGSPDKNFTKAQIESFVSAVRSALLDQDVRIFLRLQQTAKGMQTQFYDMPIYGKDHITEKLKMRIHEKDIELSCKVSPTSFFQPNSLQAEMLYSAAFSCLSDQKEKLVFDLYSGTGTLAMIASYFAEEVIGIELHPESVFDAEENLENNQITNVKFYQGDVGSTVEKLLQDPNFQSPSLVIVDPPRAGLDTLAMQDLEKISPEKILYISCNPETQLENAKELLEMGYEIAAVQPVDQFPHTAHIENILLFKKR